MNKQQIERNIFLTLKESKKSEQKINVKAVLEN